MADTRYYKEREEEKRKTRTCFNSSNSCTFL